MFGKNCPCLDFKLKIHKNIGKKRGVVETYRWWVKSNLGFAHKAPCGGAGTKCWNRSDRHETRQIWQKNQGPFPLLSMTTSVSPNLYFHKCFPGVASRQRLSFRLEWLPRLAESQWFMSLETTTSIFFGRDTRIPPIDNYRLFIDSVLEAYVLCWDRDNVPWYYKKSSFSEVLKMRMKLIILGFYTGQ